MVGCWLMASGASGQTVSQRLQNAFTQFEADSQLRHAISSLYVIDANTGEVVFDKNSQVGLAPASTQKIITSVTAFELLGKEYRYKTELKYEKGTDLSGKGVDKRFFLYASGDPTLGSWRFKENLSDMFFKKLLSAIADSVKKTSSAVLSASFSVVAPNFENHTINDRWIWQDVGNYYGASHHSLNWRENQFDICFNQRDNEGDQVLSAETIPGYVQRDIFFPFAIDINTDGLKTGKPGSGDNAYVYYPDENKAVVKGTIPPGKGLFTISASHPRPDDFFFKAMEEYMKKNTADLPLNLLPEDGYRYSGRSLHPLPRDPQKIYTHFSPPLDSIIYWFNKKSINLYGEALIKTFAYEKQGFGSTDSGVAILKKFWKEKGLDEEELNMYDGSGLSPMNRVTTHIQVEILKYARSKPYYNSFYNALPDYNGMRMKSGTIGDVKGFCGYHKAKDGKEYIFSFLVNNYSGRTSPVVSKMYKVLDVLK